MASRLRRNHSPAFKAKVAVAAIMGAKPLIGRAQEFDRLQQGAGHPRDQVQPEGQEAWRGNVFVKRHGRTLEYAKIGNMRQSRNTGLTLAVRRTAHIQGLCQPMPASERTAAKDAMLLFDAEDGATICAIEGTKPRTRRSSFPGGHCENRELGSACLVDVIPTMKVPGRERSSVNDGLPIPMSSNDRFGNSA